jgi:ATP-dependent helicase HrpB
LKTLARSSSLVLKAAPGSGKTTRVPPALLKALAGEILVLEPRRLAAKFSAERVASELGEKVGKTVGYQFRFETVESPETRLRFLTEGTLLRKIQSDPSLKKVSAVILDEFHERHLMTDAALAIVKTLQKTTRPDLKIIVMSATLDTAAVSGFLGEAPVMEVPRRPHPVQIHYLPTASNKPLELLVRDSALQALSSDQDEGDILVFLPGMLEIRRAEQALNEAFSNQRQQAPLVLSLHGQLPREEQELAIQKADRRKIILSTNVAETSLTIEGVTTVIDSGLHRQATYSWWSGLPSLRVRPISRASATQRAGRAGRTAPGRCYRLYTAGEFDARPAFETPEIQRADISQTWLDLKATGLLDGADDFQWFETPSNTSLESTWKLLYLLGALSGPTAQGRLTPLGQALSRLPIHPRLGRLIIEAKKQGVLEEAVLLASLISEGKLECRDALDHLKIKNHSGDFHRVRSRLVSAVQNISLHASLHSSLHASLQGPSGLERMPREERIRFSLLTGFPDRVARIRKTPASATRGKVGDAELVFCSGGFTHLSANEITMETAPGNDLLIALDVQEDQRRIQVRSVSAIREEWLIDLSPSLLSERLELRWDKERERVIQIDQMTYGELSLSESEKPAIPSESSAKILAKNALGADFDKLTQATDLEWCEFLSHVAERDLIEGAFTRTALLSQYFQKDTPDRESALTSLKTVFSGCTSSRELRERDWAFEILSARAPDLAMRAEQILPTFLTLPSGRKAKINYAAGKAPWVESRMQDFFGMQQAPSLLGGRLTLTVHLLAPNYRAVQVTSDLAGFWKREYPELRRALSRRYPRHYWPEDPTATA